MWPALRRALLERLPEHDRCREPVVRKSMYRLRLLWCKESIGQRNGGWFSRFECAVVIQVKVDRDSIQTAFTGFENSVVVGVKVCGSGDRVIRGFVVPEINTGAIFTVQQKDRGKTARSVCRRISRLNDFSNAARSVSHIGQRNSRQEHW